MTICRLSALSKTPNIAVKAWTMRSAMFLGSCKTRPAKTVDVERVVEVALVAPHHVVQSQHTVASAGLGLGTRTI